MKKRMPKRRLARLLLVKSTLGATLSLVLPGSALAGDSALSFHSAVESISSPFSSISDKLERAARGRVGKGGEAQLLLDDYLLRNDTSAPAKIYRLAKDGDDKAINVLGYMFDNGVGVAKNPHKAVEYFALGAYENELARYNLGVMTLNGRGVKADADKAMGYFMEIRRIPYGYVIMALHALEKGQGAIALELAHEAHKRKDEYGTYLYARLLLEKGESLNGAKMMQRAAGAGVLEAIETMVYINEHGIGAPVNNGIALGWWIVGQVASGKATLEQALESAERFNASKGDIGVARRFASKLLINYIPRIPFDYTRTLTFSDLERVR